MTSQVAPFRFIAFEGIDGSGKTSIAKELALRTNGHYYYSPPESLRHLRSLADSASPIERFQYYLRGNIITSKEIPSLLLSGHVFCDRYVFSTVIHHAEILEYDLPYPDILFPDTTVFVRATEETIENRLRLRTTTTPHEKMPLLLRTQKRYADAFSKRDDIVTIDTTGRSIEESANIVMNMLHLSF